jgi:hypothetical protein
MGDVSGFGFPITVKDPAGTTRSLVGRSNDIYRSIDPQTGMVVTGRVASVALNIEALADAGLGIPKGIADENSKPWVITFEDLNGASHTFKVTEHQSDLTLNLVVCMLENYEDAP